MVKIALATGRGVDDTRSIWIWVLVLRGRRINLLLIREGSGRLIFHRNFKDVAVAIKARAESGLLARRGR